MLREPLGAEFLSEVKLGQEFFINNQQLQDKVDQLLPSQGGLGAGFDLSASTQIVPIVDLTESAEGSNLRQDLQKSLSLSSITAFSVSATTSTLINNTGYFRVFGNYTGESSSSASRNANFTLTDGVTSKIITDFKFNTTATINTHITMYDFIVFLSAGDSLTATTNSTALALQGSTRQIADIDGNLINP